MPKLTYYGLATPNGQKVSVALEEMGIAYEPKTINILKDDQFTPEFVAINPNSKIPAIVDEDGPDGQPISVFESGAILIYLAEKTGKFMPKDAVGRYKTLQWIMFQMGGIGPMFGQFGHFFKYAQDKCTDPYPKERVFRKLGVDEETLKHLHVIHALQLHVDGVKRTDERDVGGALIDRVQACVEGTSDDRACVVFDSITALGCLLASHERKLAFMHALFRTIDACPKPCSCLVRAHRDAGDEDILREWEYEATYILEVKGLGTGAAKDVHGQILASSGAGTHTDRHDQEWDERLGFVNRFRYHLGDRDISFFKSLHQ
eukprot:jgi/Pico_ML_1/53963/g4416.t1